MLIDIDFAVRSFRSVRDIREDKIPDDLKIVSKGGTDQWEHELVPDTVQRLEMSVSGMVPPGDETEHHHTAIGDRGSGYRLTDSRNGQLNTERSRSDV